MKGKIPISSLGNLNLESAKNNRGKGIKTNQEYQNAESETNKEWKKISLYPNESTLNDIIYQISDELKIQKYNTIIKDRIDKMLLKFENFVEEEIYKENTDN